MKRNIFMAAFAAFGALFLNSCNQELDDMTPVVDESGMVTITAAFPELVESKVDFAEQGDGSGLDLTWEEEDYLTVVSGSVSEKYAIASINGKVATFTGAPVEGETFDVILSRSGDYAARTYAGQTQATVASTDHLLYDAVLKGVDTYENVSFTAEWAAEHDGTFAQNGCLMLNFKMPDDAGYLKTVTLTAPDAVFYTTNDADGEKTKTLTLSLADADMASDNVVEAYIMTSMQEASVAAETELTLTVVSNLGTWSKKFTPGAFTLKAGMRNVITLNDKDWTVPEGDGSQANPYIIRTVEDLTGMVGKLVAEKKYFAMVNDIDMASVTEWIKIENGTPIDFNGNNRTITNFKPTTCASSYYGFIGVLNGKVSNISFVDANITSPNNSACGIVCGYLGQANGNSRGDLENIHVRGSVLGNSNGVGGLVGILGYGTINRCSAVIDVKNSVDTNQDDRRTGGLVGFYNDNNAKNICTISNSWTSGVIVGDMQKTGGIIGEVRGANNTNNSQPAIIENCYSTAEVSGLRVVGGIVGAAFLQTKPTSVIKCIAWNEKIEATNTSHGNYSSGAVVGRSRNDHTLTDCVRKDQINFICRFADLQGVSATVCDQPNVTSTSKLKLGTYSEEGSIYKTNECNQWYPYHGKAAAPGETVSDVAKRLGWDEKIWDLSGDYPQLIK